MGLIEEVFHEGNINTLLGPPGSGKTNCAVFLMERAIEFGFYVYTNIHFFDYSAVAEACKKGLLPKGPRYRKLPPEIVTIKSLSQLLLGLLSTERNMVVLDEAGIFASSSAPMQKKVRYLKELAYVIRHLNSSMLLIAQSKGSLSPSLRSELVKYEMRIKRHSQYYRVLSVAQAIPRMDDSGEEVVVFDVIDRIGKIPLCKIPWDSFFIPRFKMDFDLTEAFEALGEYDSIKIREHDKNGVTRGENIIKELMDDTEKNSSVNKKVAKRQKYNEVREQYLTLEDSGEYKNRTGLMEALADMYDISTTKVRELVANLPFNKDKYNV